MKTLLSTLVISTALLAPVATFAATTPTTTNATAVAAPAAQTDKTNANVAMVKRQAPNNSGTGHQANNNGLARIQEQTRQLGATN